MHFSRYEQETIVNYNAGEDIATVYSRDPAVIRKLDALVNGYPTVYKLIKATDYDRIYEVSKSYISYRKPRNISDEQRERARKRISLMRMMMKMTRKSIMSPMMTRNLMVMISSAWMTMIKLFQVYL